MAAPDDSWRYSIDDNVETWQYVQAGTGDGVYAFKDEKPATFDTFMMLIPDTSGLNIKDFELLVGNDTPLGNFTRLASFKRRTSACTHLHGRSSSSRRCVLAISSST